MTDLSIGLVGPGAIAATHAAAIAAVEGLRLTAVAGAGEARAFAGDARAFATVEAMLAAARPDIVVVTTPSGEHFHPARAALEAGCHVLVEKPLCVDPLEAARLVGLAHARRRVAGTVSQRRCEPAHRHLAALLAQGALGRLRLIEADVHWHRSDAYYAERDWRRQTAQGGGSLANQGVHSLDLMLFLAGPVTHVSASAATLGHDIPVEDYTASLLSFASGAQGVLVTTTAAPPGRPAGLRLFTDRGACALEQETVAHWDFPDVPPPPAPSAAGSGASDPKAIGVAGHVAQWTDFRDAVRERRPPAITFEDGCAAARVCAAIYRSAAEGRRVALAEFPESIPP